MTASPYAITASQKQHIRNSIFLVKGKLHTLIHVHDQIKLYNFYDWL